MEVHFSKTSAKLTFLRRHLATGISHLSPTLVTGVHTYGQIEAGRRCGLCKIYYAACTTVLQSPVGTDSFSAVAHHAVAERPDGAFHAAQRGNPRGQPETVTPKNLNS